MTRWYVCFRCNKVVSYATDEETGDTTVNRGEFLICGQKYEAIVSGFTTKANAKTCLENDPYGIRRLLKTREATNAK